MVVEICANSYESAYNAQIAGATRIELCQELALGGITPSAGLLQKVTKELSIKTYVLIRPRSGDFTYSESEFEVMLRDIAFAKACGASGIVSGILRADNTIDEDRTKQLVTASNGMDFTFHRAFDWTPDAKAAIATLKQLGIKRVLTSGQENNVQNGFENLKAFKNYAGSDVIILPGGGIDATNILQFKEAGFAEVHASASSTREQLSHQIPMHDVSDVIHNKTRFSDLEKIKNLLNRA